MRVDFSTEVLRIRLLDLWMSMLASLGSSSMFFSINVSAEYTTGPAKCWMQNLLSLCWAELAENLGCGSEAGKALIELAAMDARVFWPWPPNSLYICEANRLSDGFGMRHWSSSTLKMPTPMRSSESWLSGNSMWATLICSISHCSSSILKMCWLNCCCRASFAKLMTSCSKEFFSKPSKPKMSKIDMLLTRVPTGGSMMRLMSFTIQPNTRS
mmetsp:Transcript_7587/g.10722  ORF Transcript_7587/g.10722 Transcript_7587/m.10722 type:complete len:213 (+) Transcript_7587:1388-2026(+)